MCVEAEAGYNEPLAVVSGMSCSINQCIITVIYVSATTCMQRKKCPGMSDAIQLVTAVDGWTAFIPGTLVTANTLQIG